MSGKEIEVGKEVGELIKPSITNEYSKLRKVLVNKTPEEVTQFTDLIVNPIQKAALEGVDVRDGYIVYPGAAECHGNLLKVLLDNGVELVKANVVPTKEWHTPLFTRDIGVIIEDVFIPSKMRFDYRQIEVPEAVKVIDPRFVFDVDYDYKLEGGDVMFLEKDLVLVGIGPRTDINGLNLLRSLFSDKEFVPFSTVKEEKAFHIDTNMGILGRKHLVALPELVPVEILKMLMEREYSFVEAEPTEYMTCCTNVIALNDRKVIAPAENKVTNRRIRESGVEVIEVELSDILSFGGGPHCLTLPLVREND